MLDSQYLSLDDYDCIGFDLDHTLCRYNVGSMIRSGPPPPLVCPSEKYIVNISRLEYELLSNFLVDKRGKLSSSLYLIVFYYISGLI